MYTYLDELTADAGEAYLAGYKEAGGLVDALQGLAGWGSLAALAAPVVAGVGTGYLASELTGPSEADVERLKIKQQERAIQEETKAIRDRLAARRGEAEARERLRAEEERNANQGGAGYPVVI